MLLYLNIAVLSLSKCTFSPYSFIFPIIECVSDVAMWLQFLSWMRIWTRCSGCLKLLHKFVPNLPIFFILIVDSVFGIWWICLWCRSQEGFLPKNQRQITFFDIILILPVIHPLLWSARSSEIMDECCLIQWVTSIENNRFLSMVTALFES